MAIQEGRTRFSLDAVSKTTSRRVGLEMLSLGWFLWCAASGTLCLDSKTVDLGLKNVRSQLPEWSSSKNLIFQTPSPWSARFLARRRIPKPPGFPSPARLLSSKTHTQPTCQSARKEYLTWVLMTMSHWAKLWWMWCTTTSQANSTSSSSWVARFLMFFTTSSLNLCHPTSWSERKKSGRS